MPFCFDDIMAFLQKVDVRDSCIHVSRSTESSILIASSTEVNKILVLPVYLYYNVILRL